MKKKKRIIALIVLFMVCIVFIIPLARCEFLTMMHGKQFDGKELETNMLAKSDYYKVLNYNNNQAEVYYVLKNGYGSVISFHNNDDKWEIEHWKTIWSSTGSASGVIWPYWWHFIYGGF